MCPERGAGGRYCSGWCGQCGEDENGGAEADGSAGTVRQLAVDDGPGEQLDDLSKETDSRYVGRGKDSDDVGRGVDSNYVGKGTTHSRYVGRQPW